MLFKNKLTYLILTLFIVIASCVSKSDKILIVVTNNQRLGNTGKNTGYYLSEVTHPYFKFVKAGFKVEFASPKGGYAPMDPKSLDLKDELNKKFYQDKEIFNKLFNTKKLSDINPKKYKAIVFAGGHGTMWDFPNEKSVSEITAKIYENGGVVAAVCHGPAALTNVKLSNGEDLIKGKKVTGFTNKEEDIVELSSEMPFMLEDKLKEMGATFEGAEPWKEKVVVDSRVVTGQNPASASKLGEEVVKLIKN